MKYFMTWLLIGSLCIGSPASAAVLNAGAVSGATSTGLPFCLRWQPVGVCFWLICTTFGCKVRTSIKVENYVPDAYVNIVKDPAGGIDASGSVEGRREGGRQTRGRDHQTFREAQVIGHPWSAGGFAAEASGLTDGLVCVPRSFPGFSYFESSADAAVWRSYVPIESLYPQALVPGLREIGNWPLNTWGSVYPRIGRVMQQEEPKAGAIIAQRAGDITTRFWQPHVYVPLDALKLPARGVRYWNPGALVETDASTGDWQMLYPNISPLCAVFGSNDAISLSSWSDGKKSADGDYQWNLWRPYQCCKKKGLFIGSIGGKSP